MSQAQYTPFSGPSHDVFAPWAATESYCLDTFLFCARMWAAGAKFEPLAQRLAAVGLAPVGAVQEDALWRQVFDSYWHGKSSGPFSITSPSGAEAAPRTNRPRRVAGWPAAHRRRARRPARAAYRARRTSPRTPSSARPLGVVIASRGRARWRRMKAWSCTAISSPSHRRTRKQGGGHRADAGQAWDSLPSPIASPVRPLAGGDVQRRAAAIQCRRSRVKLKLSRPRRSARGISIYFEGVDGVPN